MARPRASSIVVGLVAGVCAAALVACAGSARSSMAPASTGAEAGMAPAGDPRAEIDALDQQIDAELARLKLSPSLPTCAADATCGAVAPTPMAVTPTAEDPTCKPGANTHCGDVCTLSTSICGNADKICELAGQLGGSDAYANEKCAKGKTSCTAARARCCECM